MKPFGFAAGTLMLTALFVNAQSQRTDSPNQEAGAAGAAGSAIEREIEREAEQIREAAEELEQLAPQERRPADAAHAHDHAASEAAPTTRAVAVLIPVGNSGVSGKIVIEDDGRGVLISGEVRGLEPNTKHGFHIHEFGDLSDQEKGESVGGHFAPGGAPHGRQDAPEGERHVGDLGNIEADDEGIARIQIRDELVRLHGPHGVLGRAFVVHAEEDKFTQPSGDAGGRITFGTIGIANAEQPQ